MTLHHPQYSSYSRCMIFTLLKRCNRSRFFSEAPVSTWQSATRLDPVVEDRALVSPPLPNQAVGVPDNDMTDPGLFALQIGRGGPTA
jgi:hypothetical protein